MLVRKYYRLTESYRDKTGKTRQHMILALGYMDELPEEEQRYQFLDAQARTLEGETHRL